MNSSTTPNTTASQATVAESNRSRVLQHLYHNGVSSRAQIAKALNLTPSAITKITAQLIEAGAIEETGDMEGAKNRRSIGLNLDTERFHIIGVKFARSLVQVGVFDLCGNALGLEDLPPVTNETIGEAVRLMHVRLESLLDADPSIIAIAMAVPGPYMRDEGRTAVVSSMLGWRDVNFIEEFGHAFRVPVFVEQDARAGALAHYLFDPESHGEDDISYFLVGEGVGLGVIENERIINGALGAATEIGHVSIDIDGKPCDCGNRGCLERYCSTPAIREMLIEEGGPVPHAELMSNAEATRALFALAKEGVDKAVEMVRRIGRYIGYGCVNIFNTFNPQLIIIGDIVSEAGHLLLDEVRATVRSRSIREIYDSTEIRLSTMPTDATVCGTAAVAATQFLDHPSMFFDLS
ncbi:ROK family transcriptional regulator [Bifidobacterium stellenboschense]|uniref:NagC family transcriptional regulator n=1 Tax=Bifidobacterium stellenboschense TaxID=762211 RepID=A0A087E093_9BIFI|nr:ROK family transcriptional regulator [Bifidobacterium stellenboschense]KFJ01194.1 NagC family transcriptional regulator [Bifidobacterium stellenboschense]